MDNGTREGLDKFLKAASKEPETVLHYEFMQDYKVTTDINRYLLFLTVSAISICFGGVKCFLTSLVGPTKTLGRTH